MFVSPSVDVVIEMVIDVVVDAEDIPDDAQPGQRSADVDSASVNKNKACVLIVLSCLKNLAISLTA